VDWALCATLSCICQYSLSQLEHRLWMTLQRLCVCAHEDEVLVLPSGLDRWMQSAAAPYPGLMLAHKCVQMAAVQQQDHGHKNRCQTQACMHRFVISISMACSWQCCQTQFKLKIEFSVQHCVVRDLKRWSYDMHAMQELLNAL